MGEACKVKNTSTGNTNDVEETNYGNVPSAPTYSCLPYRVSTNSKRGRHFIATRSIQPLELILVDVAGVVGPATKTAPVCLACLNPSSEQSRWVSNISIPYEP